MQVVFKMSGDKEFQGKINNILKGLAQLSPLYKRWGIEALKWIQQNYQSGGAKVGGWPPLRPLTIMSRRKGSGRPLMNTGALMRLWSSRVMGWGAEIGNPSDIAGYHETGTRPYEIRPKNRKFLWFGVAPSGRWTGQQAGGHARHYVASTAYLGRIGRWRKSGSPGIFARHVHHPGLPKRRQLPNEAEIMPTIKQVTEQYLASRIK